VSKAPLLARWRRHREEPRRLPKVFIHPA